MMRCRLNLVLLVGSLPYVLDSLLDWQQLVGYTLTGLTFVRYAQGAPDRAIWRAHEVARPRARIMRANEG
jgi:hypothetical protein